jgi:carbon monoxide dehydrogenase subunit G
MAKVKRSITINSPVEKVFNYLADPMVQSEWIPSMVDVKDVSGSGVGQHYRWTYKMAGVLLKGETTVTEHIPNERRVTQSKGGVTSTWIINLEPHDGGTMMELDIEYTIPVPVIGKLAEKVVLKRNEREADLAMVNIKEQMEG